MRYEIYGTRGVADTARGESRALYRATRPQPKCHKSINSPTLNGLLLLRSRHRAVHRDLRRCLLTFSADIARSRTARVRYAIYGRSGAFDVAHEVTINMNNE